MLKYDSIHRITEFTLLKFVEITGDLYTFNKVKDELNLSDNHYFTDEDINYLVWDSGDYNHSLNKIYSTLPLFSTHPLNAEEKRYINVHLMLKQGFDWYSKFGFHVLIKSTKTNEVLLSKVFAINDFQITNNKELISGSFWMEEAISKIPNFGDILACQVTELKVSDIDLVDGSSTVGYMYNYPTELMPLIDEKPVPDYITTKILFDENHYIKIITATSENKTVEQSILDYFGQSTADIRVSHLITYGNNETEWKSIRVSNDDNKFALINIGLNLLSFIDNINIAPIVTIHVTTEILVDNKLMTRQSSVNTDLLSILPLIQAEITHPTTNFPVEIINETIINQNVIQAKDKTRIIEIYQPVFVDFINSELKISDRNVTFNSVIHDTYLRINSNGTDKEQMILSKRTSDDKIYFDLSMLVPLQKVTTYTLIDSFTNKIIGEGPCIK